MHSPGPAMLPQCGNFTWNQDNKGSKTVIFRIPESKISGEIRIAEKL